MDIEEENRRESKIDILGAECDTELQVRSNKCIDSHHTSIAIGNGISVFTFDSGYSRRRN